MSPDDLQPTAGRATRPTPVSGADPVPASGAVPASGPVPAPRSLPTKLPDGKLPDGGLVLDATLDQSPSPSLAAQRDERSPDATATADLAVDAGGRRVASTKQERDLATAVSLLRSGCLNERQISQIAQSWTSFGSEPLLDRALASGLVKAADSGVVQQTAERLLRDAIRHASHLSTNNSSIRKNRARIAKLDPAGRISQLLGIADASVLSSEEIEKRSVGSRYTLLRKLGQGGLGVVWLARDENLQRYVALKEISRDASADDPAYEHFRREAEITGRLEHPSIVPIYQFGRDEASGKSFYVMRFLGRRTLQDAITEYHERREAGSADPMMLHRLLAAFISVCHAVGHAHASRIIHRDLKPANVALDQFGQVTLLDWGLAKVNDATGLYDVGGRTEPGDLHSMGSTAVGRVIGTPLYMAPEQAAGRLEEVDELTDVYGLGGILYAILTGYGPHQATVDSMETRVGAPEVLARIVAASITPPVKLVPQAPLELNAICLKALNAKPYLRYGSAIELAEEVQRYVAGSPVRAYEAPLKRRVSHWMSKHPTLAQLILLMASLVVISAIIFARTSGAARQQLTAARYAAAQETAQDLELNLQFEAEELRRNLHFISELPLMRAIIQSQRQLALDPPAEPPNAAAAPPDQQAEQNGAGQDVAAQAAGQDGAAEADGAAGAVTLQSEVAAGLAGSGGGYTVSPEQWLGRLSELFDGFLNANPSYLMMASCLREKDVTFRELIRSERIGAGQRTIRVPRKQLTVTSASEENRLIIDSLRPGSILLVTNDKLGSNVPASNRSPLALSGVTPTYDADGELFGLNVIELDLQVRMRALLSAIGSQQSNICLTDSRGTIVLHSTNGQIKPTSAGQSITQRVPQLARFFDEGNTESQAGDGKTFYALKVDLGHRVGVAQIGIVVFPAESP